MHWYHSKLSAHQTDYSAEVKARVDKLVSAFVDAKNKASIDKNHLITKYSFALNNLEYLHKTGKLEIEYYFDKSLVILLRNNFLRIAGSHSIFKDVKYFLVPEVKVISEKLRDPGNAYQFLTGDFIFKEGQDGIYLKTEKLVSYIYPEAMVPEKSSAQDGLTKESLAFGKKQSIPLNTERFKSFVVFQIEELALKKNKTTLEINREIDEYLRLLINTDAVSYRPELVKTIQDICKNRRRNMDWAQIIRGNSPQ